MFSRFQLYSNVWSHKGVAAGKFLLSKAIDETLQDSEVRATVKTALTNIDQFGYFTEDFFWEAFRNRARTEPNSIAARLLQRKLPRHVSSLESPTTFEIEQHLADLRRRNPNVFYYKTHIRFSKIRHQSFDRIKVLFRRKCDDGRHFHQLKEIRSVSDFFTKFEDTSRVHFYAL